MLTISLLVILVTMTHYKNMKIRLTKHAQASITEKGLQINTLKLRLTPASKNSIFGN